MKKCGVLGAVVVPEPLGRSLRDAGGRVIALELTNPALRNVRFTRTSGGAGRPGL